MAVCDRCACTVFFVCRMRWVRCRVDAHRGGLGDLSGYHCQLSRALGLPLVAAGQLGGV